MEDRGGYKPQMLLRSVALFEQKELLNIILWVSVCVMSQSILIKCAQVTINKVFISLAANLDKLM